jgi:hypothetical protein
MNIPAGNYMTGQVYETDKFATAVVAKKAVSLQNLQRFIRSMNLMTFGRPDVIV